MCTGDSLPRHIDRPTMRDRAPSSHRQAPLPRRRRRGRTWARGLCALTAAASSLPLTSDAYTVCGAVPPALANRGAAAPPRRGPVPASAYCASPDPASSLASALAPPSSYLPGRGGGGGGGALGGKARVAGVPDRYGGRARGSVSPDGSGPGGCDAGAGTGPSPTGTLGFVIDDADGIGSSTAATGGGRTRLSMSSGAYGGESGGASTEAGTREGGGADADIRTAGAGASSPLKKRVIASLLRSSGSAAAAAAAAGGGGELRVPAWFPWVPTREQVQALKTKELREACGERGLEKNGDKEELQDRLLEWTKEQHRRRVLGRQTGLTGGVGGKSPASRSPLDEMIDRALSPGDVKRVVSSSSSVGDIEPLINRRKALRRSKGARQDGRDKSRSTKLKSSSSLINARSTLGGKGFGPNPGTDEDEDEEEEINDPLQLAPTDEYLSTLRKLFDSPTAKFSNYEMNEMYQAAKRADQGGNRRLAKKILAQLRDATPKDSRILRRLARMEAEEGNIAGAREILQQGIRRNPSDAYLMQGLAQLELKRGDDNAARGLFKEAIRADPKLPNPYHALGTLEHSRGNIRVATAVLRHGIKMCPDNHRLHHALGDLYREARMLGLAERAYRRALDLGPEWSRSFSYTALSYVAYERGDLSECRKWLHEGVEINGGMHSQGWLALAQLDESEGRIDQAREVYMEATRHYERRRIQRSFVNGKEGGPLLETKQKRLGRVSKHSGLSRNKEPKNVAGKRNVVRPSRSGDKWIFVYKSWARMEEHYGTFETANRVYNRVLKVFPGNSGLLLSWAQFNAKHGRIHKARTLFEFACRKAGSSRAEPYRLYGEFEMSLRSYERARSILYRGAHSLSESLDGGIGQSRDLARLYHTWAVCEWHLNNLDRAEVLFDHALRLTDAGQSGSDMRSLILYSVARFLHQARGECILAQHCVCLSLKENFMPGGSPQIWLLWSEIAKDMGNEDLARHCAEQAETLSKEEVRPTSDVSQMRRLRKTGTSASDDSASDSLPMITGPTMQKMLRKEPWHHKIVGVSDRKSSLHDEVEFPTRMSIPWECNAD